MIGKSLEKPFMMPQLDRQEMLSEKILRRPQPPAILRLAAKTLLFLLPVFAVFAFPFYVLSTSGELTPVDRIIELQTENRRPYMIVQAYSDYWGYIKLAETQRLRPKILALGTSRVMQWRAGYFRDRFYNASNGISRADDLIRFLDRIPEDGSPRLMIVGIDPNMFNPNWVWYSKQGIHDRPAGRTAWANLFLQNWFGVYVDFFKGFFRLKDVRSDGIAGFRQIGLYARSQNSGYTNDGSFLYLGHMLKAGGSRGNSSRSPAKIRRLIESGGDIYAQGSEVSPKTLQSLEKFLQEAKRRGIHVIGYVPPLAPFAYEEVERHAERYSYLPKIEPAARPLFEKYGFSFFDFIDSRKLGADDGHYVDDMHDTGEITYRLMKRIAEKEPALERELAPGLPKINTQEIIRLSLTGPVEGGNPAAA